MTDLSSHIQRLEEQLLEPDFRKQASAVAELLTEDFEEFGASGRIFDKASILSHLQEEAPARLSLSDFRSHSIASDVVLVT